MNEQTTSETYKNQKKLLQEFSFLLTENEVISLIKLYQERKNNIQMIQMKHPCLDEDVVNFQKYLLEKYQISTTESKQEISKLQKSETFTKVETFCPDFVVKERKNKTSQVIEVLCQEKVSQEKILKSLREYKWNTDKVVTDIYDSKLKAKENSSNNSTSLPKECPICYDEFKDKEVVKLSCGHISCHQCFKEHLSSKLNSQQIGCFGLKCTNLITKQDVELCCTDKNILESFISHQNELFYLGIEKCQNPKW